MANTAANIQKLYIAYFNRPADPAGLAYWMNSSLTIGQIANSFGAQAEYNAAFAGQTTESIIATLYQNLFGHGPDFNGLMYWVGEVNSGKSTIGNVAINILSGATGADLAAVNAKVTASTSFTAAIDTTPEAVAYSKANGTAAAKAWLSAVTTDATAASQILKQDATISAILASDSGATTGVNVALTVGQDTLTGTVNNDTMTANVVQNSLGQQVNTLGSGDVLNGGAGNDTLTAKITNGAFAGNDNNGTMPIQPETKGIELVKLQAVNSTINGSNSNVYVNAKDMLGVNKIASNYSDANLVIQNLTTKDDGGATRALSTMTVGMEYTGNSDHNWEESDLSVYFDQDYLNPEITFTKPSVDFRLMNEDAYDATVNSAGGPRHLDGVYTGQMDVTINGTKFSLAPELAKIESATGSGSEISTYAQMLAAVQTAIAALKAANPTNAALQTLTAVLGADFTSDISPTTGALRVGKTITLTIDGATDGKPNTMVVAPTDLQLLRSPTATVANNNRYERANPTPSVQGQLLSIKVDLEKVGLAGDGGDLLIGSMFKDGTNTYSDLYKGKGIDQFDVTVYGGSDKPSSLASMSSTGNNLKVVNVVTSAAQANTYASLTIGNSQTSGAALSKTSAPSANNKNALKDVKTFDASGLKGDLTLFAGLSNEVSAKYLNAKDIGAPAADNVTFTYTSGTGNDYINLHMDSSNFAIPGTATREDLKLNVSTGAGNDTIVTQIEVGAPATNWYANQHINADLDFIGGNAIGQLQLNGGDGDDVINNRGTGDFAINGGAGSDTVYADNTGVSASGANTNFNAGRATWIFNSSKATAADLNVNNALSLAAVTGQSNVVNLNLKVSFKGYEKTVVVANSMNATTGVTVNDLVINNAIKDAINNDAVLSKLLVAEDGPARTLIVRSLIDGAMTDTGVTGFSDVKVSLSSTALTASQALLTGLSLLSDATAATLGFGAASSLANASTVNGRYDSKFATDGVNAYNGGASTSTSDNMIAGGTGNDVIVLGTGANSNDTVAWSGFANGTDSIVNFNTTFNAGGVVTYPVVAATTEVFTVTFADSDGTPANQTIIFDGDTVTLSAPAVAGVIPAKDIAMQFAQQFGTANWTVTGYTLGDTTLTLTRTATGVVTDVVAADFTGTYFGVANGNGAVTISTTTQGAVAVNDGTASTFAITLDTANTAALAAGTIVFDGTTVNYAAGDGSLTLANKISASTFANWNVVQSTVGVNQVLTFTAKAPGATPIGTDVIFKVDAGSGADGIIGSIGGGVVGTANSGAAAAVPTTSASSFGAGFDYIDFSAYGAKAVYVNGTLIAGTAPAVGQTYINLVNGSGDALGQYTMTQYTEAGATDTVVGVIGVADFGTTMTFVSGNFILV
ncbi:beta strand repeat-containing protein [Undibacterium danionis]|uniref:Beta strand repeat-containing protein n=1 Tax=Undibacterium danionis TaxID=1812100 RepID=A0ABV6IH51_9BURK